MAEATTQNTVSKIPGNGLILGAIIAVLVLGGIYFFLFNPSSQGLAVLNPPATQQADNPPTTAGEPQLNVEEPTISDIGKFDSDVINPADYASRELFFREVYRPRRESYKIFEKAAAFLGKDIEGVKKYFGLESEEEIYENLQKPAEDFSEIVYLFSQGKYFTIGLLGKEYYNQPEFYPTFKATGISTWTRSDSRYWAPHGFGSYPSIQYDELSLSGRKESTGVVFIQSSWGVQTHQGFSLHADEGSKQFFDISITPQNFLIGPAFPKFAPNWVERVVITAKLKDGTPPGTYKILINTYTPPKELKEQWEYLYKNLYFDASISPIQPSGSLIEFVITVKE